MTKEVGDGGSFQKKLEAMEMRKVIGSPERKLLETVIDAGNAAAHRGWSPEPKRLHSILSIVENLVERLFLLRRKEKALRRGVPRRGRH
jgi:hypothetical protein